MKIEREVVMETVLRKERKLIIGGGKEERRILQSRGGRERERRAKDHRQGGVHRRLPCQEQMRILRSYRGLREQSPPGSG